LVEAIAVQLLHHQNIELLDYAIGCYVLLTGEIASFERPEPCMIHKRKFCLMLAVVGFAQTADLPCRAQSYPARPIRLIVPFAPGGQPDLMARLVAQHLSAGLGAVVVENRQGAGGTLGAKAVAAAEPDGHTLLLGTTGVLAISPVLYKDAGYDPVRSFSPVATVSSAPFLLVASPNLPVRTVAELIAYAKANPGKLNFGAPTATPPHLACEMLKRESGIDIIRVPYAGNHVAGLLGGQTHIVCEASTVLLPHIRAGTIRPLAVLADARIPDLPDVPTLAETGLPNLVVSVWAGILVPARTPDAIVRTLNRHINDGLQSASMKESLIKLGAEPRVGSPQEFSALIADEVRKWRDVVQLSGAKLE
jgi:tripartite-type tricarboxylate transporter receptor subunit TctC